MKYWVKPFLIKKMQDQLVDYDREWQKRKMGNYKRRLKRDENVYSELSECLNTHFGIEGICGDSGLFSFVFGSVLADLPQHVFDKLCNMKNLFFTFTPNIGAEVKHFILERDIKIDEHIIIVTFPYISILSYPRLALRGSIAHEFVHVYAHTDKIVSSDDMENEADEIAKKWGFEKEIKELRKFYEE